MHCPTCRKFVEPRQAWKGLTRRFYCSEFCAEVESFEPDPDARARQKAEIDRQYIARLGSLLPYLEHRGRRHASAQTDRSTANR